MGPTDWVELGNGSFHWDANVTTDAQAKAAYGKDAKDVTENGKPYTYTASNERQAYVGPGGKDDFGYTYTEMKTTPTGKSTQEWDKEFQAPIKMADPLLAGMQTAIELEAGGLTGGLSTLASEGAQMASMAQTFGSTGEVGATAATSTAVAEGTHSVYQGVDEEGVVRYVGITGRDFTLREAEHLASGTAKASLRYSIIEGATSLTRDGARVIEQNLINSNGLSNLLNKINSIAPKNWTQLGVNPF